MAIRYSNRPAPVELETGIRATATTTTTGPNTRKTIGNSARAKFISVGPIWSGP